MFCRYYDSMCLEYEVHPPQPRHNVASTCLFQSMFTEQRFVVLETCNIVKLAEQYDYIWSCCCQCSNIRSGE